MGLDLYVGPVTRYTAGEWLTAVQQAGLDAGLQVQIARARSDAEDVVTDPIEIREAVRSWQRGLVAALGGHEGWPEDIDLPYWTDKPDWDGYGGLVLLAAYSEKPELRPQRRAGLFGKRSPTDSAREFSESRAYKEAAASPSKYPTLLAGVEWWLPVTDGPSVFSTKRVTGEQTTMGRVDQLVLELETLIRETGIEGTEELRRIRQDGPPAADADAESAGRFGLAVFHSLALTAQQERQPLLLDY